LFVGDGVLLFGSVFDVPVPDVVPVAVVFDALVAVDVFDALVDGLVFCAVFAGCDFVDCVFAGCALAVCVFGPCAVLVVCDVFGALACVVGDDFGVCGFTDCDVFCLGGLFAEPPPLPWACSVTLASSISAAAAIAMFQRFM
jgi:hypothetical protein